MRKSFVRFSLVMASAFVVFGQAAAQSASVNFWYNSFGDAATNQPSVINVTQGTPYRLSVYVRTANVGALSGVNVLFGYSTATTTGSGATPADTNATFNAFNWGQADISTLLAGAGGGGGPANGTTRPYGYFMSGGNLTTTFAGSGDGVNFHVADITLNINAAPGTNIPISLWSFASSATSGTDNYAGAVLNGNSSEFFPTSPYTGTLHVQGVPEPASLAALSLGALALIRRRRRSR